MFLATGSGDMLLETLDCCEGAGAERDAPFYAPGLTSSRYQSSEQNGNPEIVEASKHNNLDFPELAKSQLKPRD